MMSTRAVVLGLLGLFLIALIFQTFYVVDQRQQAIVVQFGDPRRVMGTVKVGF